MREREREREGRGFGLLCSEADLDEDVVAGVLVGLDELGCLRVRPRHDHLRAHRACVRKPERTTGRAREKGAYRVCERERLGFIDRHCKRKETDEGL